MVQGREADARRLWLLSQVDTVCVDAVDTLLSSIVDRLSIATADAVTVRALSEDGRSLLPVAVHHPDPDVRSAMASVMAETVQPADSGLWLPVIEERAPRRWQTPAGEPPAEASGKQADFLRRFPIRAVLGVPLIVDDRIIGGVSVVRFGVDEAFTDEDETLASACAARIAAALDFRSRILLLQHSI